MPEAGRLLVCATPIGNLGDVTLRVLDALRAADVIVAEDTRVTRKLLARYDIHVRLERYDEATAAVRTPELVARVAGGERIALVSDAGTPGISDPGARLVDAALEAGVAVDVLPGPSAIVTALVASGLPTHAFYFGGFLPRKPGERRRTLEALEALDATLIFYESPHRTPAAVASIAAVLPGRQAAMARELTKLHEEVLRGSVEELARSLETRDLKGEVVVLVGPPPPGRRQSADEAAVRARVDELAAQGSTTKDAIKAVAAQTGLGRNAVYRIVHGGDAER